MLVRRLSVHLSEVSFFFSLSARFSFFFLTLSFMIIVQLVKYVSIVVLHQAAMLGLAIPVR